MNDTDEETYRQRLIEHLETTGLDCNRLKLDHMTMDLFYEIPSDDRWTERIRQVLHQVLVMRDQVYFSGQQKDIKGESQNQLWESDASL
jgi:hypothetical protein